MELKETSELDEASRLKTPLHADEALPNGFDQTEAKGVADDSEPSPIPPQTDFPWERDGEETFESLNSEQSQPADEGIAMEFRSPWMAHQEVPS